MDARRFDEVVRGIGCRAPRRALLWAAAGSLGARFGADISRAKQQEKPLKLNEFGCVPVGKACRGKNGNCCSGVCDGKKPKKGERDRSRCAGHDASTCRPGQDSCQSVVSCMTTTGFEGRCFTTTGDAGYCAIGNACMACATDADCVRELGAGAACVKCDLSGCGVPGLTTVCKSPSPD